MEMQKITYLSKLDNSMQPALVWGADGEGERPLAVCLHTWSLNIDKEYDHYLAECQKRNWNFIFPLFRGPNWTPEACGSDLVVSDLECAVSYMQETYHVDNKKIYLVGGSGGGHASTLMAGRRPELFTAIASFCPISDLVAWYKETYDMKQPKTVRDYDDHIFDACGGDPTTSPEAAREAKHRSPLTWLAGAKGKVILSIETGIHDGHTGSVPISHAFNAFNAVAEEKDRFTKDEIDFMVRTEKVPEHLQYQGVDPAYGEAHKVLLRRESGMVRMTLFEGGHNILASTAFAFLEKQTRGEAPDWSVGKASDNQAATELTK